MLPDIKSTKNPIPNPKIKSNGFGKAELNIRNGKKKMKGENNGDTFILFNTTTCSIITKKNNIIILNTLLTISFDL
jgi:hypothetical protein